jgi:dihydrodipicolinate synthase/N-acetylneuraminate lyase
MKAHEYFGIIPPILTGFDRQGNLDERATRKIVSFVLPHVHGLYPVGTYGSGPLMTVDERKRALEIILDEVSGRIPVVAHVGHAGTPVAVELAKHAKSAGAAGIGAISPYYAPNLPEDSMFDYFGGLIDAVNEEDFPVFVYNNAHYSQNSITPNLLRRLAERGLRGCKDSSFDLVNFFQYQDAVKEYEGFNVIVGTEAFFVAAFDAGAIGTVCGLGNIFPKILRKLYDALAAGKRKEAMDLQRQILRIRKITKEGPTVPIMHSILRMRGIDGGESRSPYLPISDQLSKKVEKELRDLGVL